MLGHNLHGGAEERLSAKLPLKLRASSFTEDEALPPTETSLPPPARKSQVLDQIIDLVFTPPNERKRNDLPFRQQDERCLTHAEFIGERLSKIGAQEFAAVDLHHRGVALDLEALRNDQLRERRKKVFRFLQSVICRHWLGRNHHR